MNKRLTFLYFSVALTAGIILACSGEEAEAAAMPDVVAEPGEDTTAREFGYYERNGQHPYNNKLLAAWKLAKKKAKYVDHFCNTYRGTLFLAVNDNNPRDNKAIAKQRYGLIDAKGNVLLPLEYELIGNPGFILDDYVEVKQNGKYGLYNYADQQLIRPEYDAIYPSRIVEYIAIGQKGSKLFKIYADGKSKAFKDGQPAPNYARLVKDYRYNTQSEHYGQWITTYALNDLGSDDFYPYSTGLIVLPSYLARLKIFPNTMHEVGIGWQDFDSDSLDLRVIDAKRRNEDVYANLFSFYSLTADARGYDEMDHYLVTTDRKNGIKASKSLLSASSYDLMNANGNELARPKVRFVNDSIVEVRRFVTGSIDKYLGVVDYEEDEMRPQYVDRNGFMATAGPKYLSYQNYTKYEYYLIKADGSVKALNDGNFPMASVIPLTKDHFKGCFARVMGTEDARLLDIYDDEMEGYPILAFTDHLSLEDLEYMRNEIYARHGFKFKDQAWAKTFAIYSWYKPKRSNVNSLLTPVEKQNLELIKQVEKQLRATPEALVHEAYEYMVIAG